MLSRRRFLAVTAAGAASAAAASALEACGSAFAPTSVIEGPPTVTVALPAVGQTVGVDGVGQGGQGIAVTRISAGEVVAVSRQCTHQACTVGLPASPGAVMVCPCHGSFFTVRGAVVQGPADAPLRSFVTAIDTTNDQVVITNS